MFKIVSRNGATHLYQDGQEIHHIKTISFVHDALTDKPELNVIFARDHVEIDLDVMPELPEFYKPFYQKIPFEELKDTFENNKPSEEGKLSE